jgi:hypothetical protein
MQSNNKDGAFKFLLGLGETLAERLPSPVAIKQQMLDLSQPGNSIHQIRENRFLYHFAIRHISAQMQTVTGIGQAEARKALLCEYHAKASDIASGNAFRRSGYPFGKAVGLDVEQTMQGWTAENKSAYPFNQAYPDLGIRSPFPYKIVFDAKYFDNNSSASAEKALVEGVYEAAHYRSLPKVTSRSTSDPGWDYEFGCLLAYDASDAGVLETAWTSVRKKSAFWEGGNIFVMIIRGRG